MFSFEKSILFVVDVQDRLAELVQEPKSLLKNISILVKAAQLLDIPILWTEQLPEKLGATVGPIRQLLVKQKPIAKSSFGCCGEKQFMDVLTVSERREVIVSGIETHVCIYQTVGELLERQYAVAVVADAVSSRTSLNQHIGLERIKALGGIITSTEMILLELLKTAKHNQFRGVLELIR